MTLQITLECSLMLLLQNIDTTLNISFLIQFFYSPGIKQHKYVALRAQEAKDFPSSSVASDPLPTLDLAPVHATYFAPVSAPAPDPINDHTTVPALAPAPAPAPAPVPVPASAPALTPGNDPTTASAPGKFEFVGQ